MTLTSSQSGDASGLHIGAQRPRICHVPEYTSSTGDEAIELAAMAGLFLDDWQQFVLRHALGERPDGKWAAQTVGLCVGRQNGKGSILEARELAGLFLLGERLILHTAHLQKTATQHFNRLKDLIRSTPDLSKRVAKMPEGKGSEAIHLKTGQTIFFATRSGGGGRGLTSDLIVFDEAMYLSDQDVNALVPSLAARSMTANIQLWYTGSAVDQMDSSQDGVPFAKVREAGTGKSHGTAYFEWSLDFDNPDRVPEEIVVDPESARVTNPGHGIRISPEWVVHERTVVMSRRGFCVERYGVGDWPATSEDSNRVIPLERWVACAEHDESNRIVGRQVFALDINPDRTWGSIGVAGCRSDGLWQFAVADRRRGTDWIVPSCVDLYGSAESAVFVVLARSPAEALVDDMKARGLPIVKASGADYGIACGLFFDSVEHDEARYPHPQRDLDDALSGARKSTQVENAWTWSRKQSTSPDISPLVAATLALWGARTQLAPQVHSVAEALGRLRGEERSEPVPAAVTVEPSEGQTFIPLDAMPVRRGLFRP